MDKQAYEESQQKRLIKEASKFYIKKITQLDKYENEIERDDTVHKIHDPNHIMYKLDPLESDNLVYEFLIEYDIRNPSVGIYYGCKVLNKTDIQNDAFREELQRQVNEEWTALKLKICNVLDNTFASQKKFLPRVKQTDNAWNNTYWPFWFTLYEDEDVYEVGVRALKIIREIYVCHLSHKEIVIPDIKQKRQSVAPTPLAFTNSQYEEWKKEFGEERVSSFIDVLTEHKIIEKVPFYERAWRIRIDMTNFAILVRNICYEWYSGNKKKQENTPYRFFITLFMNEDYQPFNDNLKKSYKTTKVTKSDGTEIKINLNDFIRADNPSKAISLGKESPADSNRDKERRNVKEAFAKIKK